MPIAVNTGVQSVDKFQPKINVDSSLGANVGLLTCVFGGGEGVSVFRN